MLKNLLNEIDLVKNHEKAIFLQRYFKTGSGKGDIFLGITITVLI